MKIDVPSPFVGVGYVNVGHVSSSHQVKGRNDRTDNSRIPLIISGMLGTISDRFERNVP